MIFEGEIGKGNLGGIAVDDISINNHISQEDCASKYEWLQRPGKRLPRAQFLPCDGLCLARLDLEFQYGL